MIEKLKTNDEKIKLFEKKSIYLTLKLKSLQEKTHIN